MLKSHTTLILGAGASRAYGFPAGQDLLNALLQGDGAFTQLLMDLGRDAQEWERVQDTLYRFQPESVDEFLARYPEHAELTKMAIAFWLTKFENVKAHQNPNNADSWYRFVLKDVLDNDPLLGDGLLSVVTFNYDLSLEAYMVETLRVRRKISVERAREGVAKLRIQHIYGNLGTTLATHQAGRPYGPISTPEALRAAAEGISTCFEPESRDAVVVAKNLINESANVLFLGFGFSNENLQRLDLRNCLKAGARVIASLYRCPDGLARLQAVIPTHAQLHHATDAGVPVTLSLAQWMFRSVV